MSAKPFERQRLDCSPFTSLVTIEQATEAPEVRGPNGEWSPFLVANMRSANPIKHGVYEPPGYIGSLLCDWEVWSVNNADTQRESLTLRQPFPVAVSETIERLRALYGQKMRRIVGRQPFLHMAIAHGAVMLYNNPAIRTFETVHTRWYERVSAACIGTPQEEVVRTLLDGDTLLSLRAPSSPQRSGKSDMTISVRPEVRRAVATIKPPAGMTLQDIALLCACTYFVPQPETPPNYREEMQHGVDNCLQLISYKARVANNAIAEYHADMGLEWDPDCSIWPSAYTPYVELLDSLRMDYGRESRGRNREAREDKAVGGEVM